MEFQVPNTHLREKPCVVQKFLKAYPKFNFFDTIQFFMTAQSLARASAELLYAFRKFP